MSFEQYTQCEQASGHKSMNQYAQAFLYAGPFAGIGALIVGVVNPLCGIIVAEVTAALWGIAYCDWWLYHRLICLGGDKTAVGMVVSNEPPNKKTGFDAVDTDFSSNLLLASNSPKATQAMVEASSPYGNLVKEQDSIKAAGLPWTADPATDQGTGIESWCLHIEFEGAGVSDAMIGFQVALGLSVAALIACLADALVGTALAIILAILALLAALLGIGVGLGDQGTPEDVGLPSIETNNSGGVGADILGVMGTWVYDSGHNNQGKGWNEIHPVKMAQKLATWNGAWNKLLGADGGPADIGTIIAAWTEKVGEAGSPLTVGEQGKPQNQWAIHPLIDGCNAEGSDGPPKPPN
jgi:hypothetical protein